MVINGKYSPARDAGAWIGIFLLISMCLVVFLFAPARVIMPRIVLPIMLVMTLAIVLGRGRAVRSAMRRAVKSDGSVAGLPFIAVTVHPEGGSEQRHGQGFILVSASGDMTWHAMNGEGAHVIERPSTRDIRVGSGTEGEAYPVITFAVAGSDTLTFYPMKPRGVTWRFGASREEIRRFVAAIPVRGT